MENDNRSEVGETSAAANSTSVVTSFTFETMPVYPRDFDKAFPARARARERGGGLGSISSRDSRNNDRSSNNNKIIDDPNYFSLPRIVRLGLPAASALQCPPPTSLSHVTRDDDVILLETRRTVKCVAKALAWDSEARLYAYASSQPYTIPINFPGWMCHLDEYSDTHVRRFTSVAELAAARGYVTGVIAEQRCPCLVSVASRRHRLRHHGDDMYVKGTVHVGDVLYPDGVLQGLRSPGSRSLFCRRSRDDDITTQTYLQCRNSRGQRVLLNTAQVHNGGCCCSFIALRADGNHTSGCAFLFSDIISHMTSSAPIRVKLIIDDDDEEEEGEQRLDGKQPIGAFELCDIICENVLVASRLREPLQLFEIPVSSRLQIYPAVNSNGSKFVENKRTRQFFKRTLVSNNENSMLDFVNAIRPSSAAFWEQFQFDDVNTTSPGSTLALAGYPGITRKEILTRQLSAAHLVEDEGDNYATLPADARTAAGRSSVDDGVSRCESRDEDALSWRSKVTDCQLESDEGYLLPEGVTGGGPKVKVTSAENMAAVAADVIEPSAKGLTSRPLTPSLNRPPAPLPLPFKHVYPKPDADSSLDNVDYININEGFERTNSIGSGRSQCLSSVSEYQASVPGKSLMQRLSERLNTRLRLEMGPVMTEAGGGGGEGSTVATPSPTTLRPPVPLPDPTDAPATSTSGDSGFTASSVSLYADFGRSNSRDWAGESILHQPWTVSTEVKDMSVEEVCAALMHIGFNRQEADLFLEAQVDGKQLVELTNDLLREAFPSLNGLQRKKVLDFARGWRPRRWKSADLLADDLDSDPFLVHV